MFEWLIGKTISFHPSSAWGHPMTTSNVRQPLPACNVNLYNIAVTEIQQKPSFRLYSSIRTIRNQFTLMARLPLSFILKVKFSRLVNGSSLMDRTLQWQMVSIISPHTLSPLEQIKLFSRHGFRVAHNTNKFKWKWNGVGYVHETIHSGYKSQLILSGIPRNWHVYSRCVGAIWSGDKFTLAHRATGHDFQEGSNNAVHILSGGIIMIVSNSVCYVSKHGILGD
jgi:hypothetical protein